MKTNYLVKLSALILLFALSSCQENNLDEVSKKQGKLERQTKSSLKKKVLVVGFDGIQFEKIAGTSTPNLDKLKIVKGYAGGIDNTSSEQKTSSGPGWSTILTGVWVNKHGVTDNNTSHISKAKSVFQLIKESNSGLKTASVVTWGPIHDFFR
ncbi:alkaline phosphatase family protein [Tenacibaculum singaporense]|uniref:Type I phosphodiesterase/nucleotide pyrophosphatase n=1 Tax=Tenacibaculum singaporense TaxID=2358479 RepID=A0A3S8R9L3_9FLAO|nr:alkaline phosphatase family protein [Tenacibaculum singaporense]AZJ36491.1 hypothetical protein D6T69_13545 [Tenacibaculum singaporense]